MSGFSAHADEPELLDWLAGFAAGRSPGRRGRPASPACPQAGVCLVHGDPARPARRRWRPEGAGALGFEASTSRDLASAGGAGPEGDALGFEAYVPRWHETVTLDDRGVARAPRRLAGPVVARPRPPAAQAAAVGYDPPPQEEGPLAVTRLPARSPITADEIAADPRALPEGHPAPGAGVPRRVDLRLGDRARLLPRLDRRRAGGGGARARQLRPARRLRRERHPRPRPGRRDPRLLQRLPPPGDRGGGARVRQGRPLPVPLPRLDLRPRRAPHPGQAHRGPRGLQPRDLGPDADPRRDLAGLRLPLLRRRGHDARPADLHGRLVRPPRRLRARHGHACGGPRG